MSVQYVENVPVDIDGTVIYVVPENSNGELKACKCGRPWFKAESSKIREYTKGPRLLLNCRGSYICKSKNCKNIGDLGLNQRDLSYKNENLVCSVCGVDASYIRCDAKLILERNVEKKIITCKHYGTYTCAVEVKGRVKKDELKSISEKFPKLTREVIIRQKVQSARVVIVMQWKHPKCTQIQRLLITHEKECSLVEDQMVTALQLLMLLGITLFLKRNT